MITHFRGILLSFAIQIKAVIEKIVEYEILWYSNKGQEESRVQAEIKVSFYCNQSPFGIVPDSAHSHNSITMHFGSCLLSKLHWDSD